MSHESSCSVCSVCSVCSRLTGFGDEDRGEPPVNLARCPAPGGLECRAVAQAVAQLERGIGQMRLIAGLPLPPDVAAKVAEADRLRKLFDDAGQGEHNVLALIDHYQRNSMDADERLRAPVTMTTMMTRPENDHLR